MGEDYSLYTGTEPGDEKESYFVFHHTRFLFGGWSWDDTFDWYKITKDAYERLCSIEPYINN